MFVVIAPSKSSRFNVLEREMNLRVRVKDVDAANRWLRLWRKAKALACEWVGRVSVAVCRCCSRPLPLREELDVLRTCRLPPPDHWPNEIYNCFTSTKNHFHYTRAEHHTRLDNLASFTSHHISFRYLLILKFSTIRYWDFKNIHR